MEREVIVLLVIAIIVTLVIVNLDPDFVISLHKCAKNIFEGMHRYIDVLKHKNTNAINYTHLKTIIYSTYR